MQLKGDAVVTITEFVDHSNRSMPPGWRVVWVDMEAGGQGLMGWTVKSPLTGAWLAVTFDALNTGESYAARVDTLRGARAMAVPGNGKRYGGHSSINSVLTVR